MGYPIEIVARSNAARSTFRAALIAVLAGSAALAGGVAVAAKHIVVADKKEATAPRSKEATRSGKAEKGVKDKAAEKAKTAAGKKKSSAKASQDRSDVKPSVARAASKPKTRPPEKRRASQPPRRRAVVMSRKSYELPADLLASRARIVDRPVMIQAGPGRIDYARLDARLALLVREPGMVGMAVAIVERGKLNFVKGYGVTEFGGEEPVSVRTVFRWASLSKTIASTMIVKLAEEKRLSLDDPIEKFDTTLRLPLDREKVATVADLLSHRLGLPHNAYDDRLEQGEDPRLIRRALGTLKPTCAVGTCFDYQNIAFDAASEIVARVTRRSYAEAVEESLFAPLGMRDATFGRPGLVTAKSWAQPHVGTRTSRVDEPYYRVPAAGGVNSSIFDLGIWMRAQMGEAAAILPRRVLDLVHAPQVSTHATSRRTEYDREMSGTSYAFGWRNAYYGGRRLVGHRGAVRGYRSLISFDPVSETGVAVLWNSQSTRPVGIPLELFDMLLGRQRKDWLKLDGKAPIQPPVGDELSPDDRSG